MKEEHNNTCNRVVPGPPRTTWPPLWLHQSRPGNAAEYSDANVRPVDVYPGCEDSTDPGPGNETATSQTPQPPVTDNRECANTIYALLPCGDLVKCDARAIPPEAIYWCREGDKLWTPCRPAAPTDAAASQGNQSTG
jgi:hypothetical protein